ncbi:MAG: sterol desaturase family protein [Cyclobacteriaceae bacterium]
MAHIHKPKNSGSGTVFKNPVLERLTKTHIAVPLILFGIISTVLFTYGIIEGYFNPIVGVGIFFAGFLSFTLIEYIMHRFVFHLTPKTPKQEKFAYTVHGVHHDYPKDKDRLAMPIPMSLLLSTGFFFLYKAIMGVYAFAFLPGFLIGYASYLGVHYMVHAYQPPKNWFKILWVHHGIHHYKDPGNAFGVSSPFWDYIFRTMPRK